MFDTKFIFLFIFGGYLILNISFTEVDSHQDVDDSLPQSGFSLLRKITF